MFSEEDKSSTHTFEGETTFQNWKENKDNLMPKI